MITTKDFSGNYEIEEIMHVRLIALNWLIVWWTNVTYRQTSNVSTTEYQNWNVSRLVLQSCLLNPLNSGVK